MSNSIKVNYVKWSNNSSYLAACTDLKVLVVRVNDWKEFVIDTVT